MTAVVTTENFEFKQPSSEEDFAFIFQMLKDPKIVTYITDGVPFSEDQFEGIRNAFIDHWKEHGFGPGIVYDRTTQKPVGAGGFKMITVDEEKLVDLGLMLLQKYQGKGYGNELFVGLMNYGLENLGFDNITTTLRLDNAPARAVIEKYGFEYVRQIERENYGMRFEDQAMFVLTKDKWQAQQSSKNAN